jgi:hypothetical protein
VRRIFRIFGPENCLILLSEDLATDHNGTLQRVLKFLDVDDTTISAPSRVFQNRYTTPMNRAIYQEVLNEFYFDIRELERLLRRDSLTPVLRHRHSLDWCFRGVSLK